VEVDRLVEYKALFARVVHERVERRAYLEFGDRRERGVLGLLQTEGAERRFVEADEVGALGQTTWDALDLFRRIERGSGFARGDAHAGSTIGSSGSRFGAAALSPKITQSRHDQKVGAIHGKGGVLIRLRLGGNKVGVESGKCRSVVEESLHSTERRGGRW
jgi:hypothetical protein